MSDDGLLERKLNERAAVLLKLSGAGSGSDAAALFLLGDCLIEAGAARYAEGRRTLARALSLEPNSASAAQAWFQLARVGVELADDDMAVAAIKWALPIEWRADRRGLLLMWRAQIAMRRRQLKLAILDYQASLDQFRSPQGRALARYGLAVSLDRSHRTTLALTHAKVAAGARFGASANVGALELPELHLSPSYERYYYRALGALAEAEALAGQSEQVGMLQASQLMWLSFTQAADDADPWLPRARYHLNRVRSVLDVALQEEDDDDDDPGWIERLGREVE